MIKTLKDTSARDIQDAVLHARHNLGTASGMVFTLVVAADLHDYDAVLDACVMAGREHPSRILLVTNGMARADRLDAEVHVGEDVPGEIVALRFHGVLAEHRETVLLPLLLPDSPTVVWWPGSSPASLVDDPVGRLGQRRITDAMGVARPLEALEIRAANLAPGDTDLTWTRLTPWRALLTASLDQYPAAVVRVLVTAAANNAAGMLLAAWLESRLHCPVELEASEGPGITAVRMTTTGGDISITRTDGRMAVFEAPKTPQRTVALRRRNINQLITEELRRMDPDEVLAAAMETLLVRCSRDEGRPRPHAEAALRPSRSTQVE